MRISAFFAPLMRHPAQPWLAAALVALAFATFPPAPKDIGTDGDVSWGAVLSYAHEHRLQFGPEIVYTYGPLGFLIQGYFSPHAANLRMLADVAVCFTAAAGLCLVAWRLRLGWRLLLLGSFVFATSNLEGRSDLVLDVAFFCWGLLCFIESGPRLGVSLCFFIVLTVFAALAKISFLFLGGVCVALITFDLFLRQQRRLGLGVIAGFAAGVILGWVATGQHVRNLPGFLVNALAVVRAYNEALGWEGLSAVSRSGFVLTLLNLIIVALAAFTAFERRDQPSRWRRALLFTWASFLTFSVWKHSFLREDFRHPAFLMSFTPVIAFGLLALPSAALSARRWVQALSVIACLFAVLHLQWLYFPSPAHSLRTPLRAWLYNLHALADPAAYRSQMREATEPWRQEAQLPNIRKNVGDATADCFGFKQVYLLYNGLDYRPRPIFQSFLACNDRLMGLNERYYLSNTAPEFVLFSLAPVDRRFPPLEDARVLRTLLFNYEPAALEQDFLLLKSKQFDSPRLTFLHEGIVRPGQPVDVRAYGDRDLWLEIHVEPSWPGRVRAFLYRAPMVRLAAYGEPGKALLLRRRAPPAMLAAGFLASPLLSSTSDVLNLYKGTTITRPGAYSIEFAPGTGFFWQRAIHFRIFRVDNKLGRCLPADWEAR